MKYKLNEDPEDILNRHPRGYYNSRLFWISDDGKTGLFSNDLRRNPSMIHPQLYRAFRENNLSLMNVIGDDVDRSRERFSKRVTGTILLPGELYDKTVISTYRRTLTPPQIDMLSKILVDLKLPPPYIIEKSATGDEFSDDFESSKNETSLKYLMDS
jgi:hypothetical protein